MSKKIISAILTIAMIASMFTMVFVTPASAATNYKADVDAIKTAVETVLVKGLLVDEPMLEKLVAAGLIEKKGDDGKYPILKQRVTDDATYYIQSDAHFLAQANITNPDGTGALDVIDSYMLNYVAPTTAKEAVEKVLQFAIYVYTFGQEADSELFDASFNGANGRQKIYKKATDALAKVMKAFAAEVEADKKPAGYQKAFDQYYYFSTKSYYYNSSLGINPYYFLNYASDKANGIDAYYNGNVWANQLGINSLVKWYSFEEIRANSDWAALLAKFELALRASYGNNCKEVLYYDFVKGAYAELNGNFDALCKAIIGTTAADTYKASIDVTVAAKAYTKLACVLDVYNLYIKDSSNNMYTTTARDLYTNALMADKIVSFVGKDPLRVMTLDADRIEELANAIISGLETLAPVFGQELTSADLAAGVAAVKKADGILAAYPVTETLKKELRQPLIDARNNLANMLPASVGAQAKILVAAGSFSTDKYASADNVFTIAAVSNDEFMIKFTPSVFAYLNYTAKLAAAYDTFYNLVNTWTAGSDGIGGTANGNGYVFSKDNLKAVLEKYDFLVGGNFVIDATTKEGSIKFDAGYLYALTGMDEAAFKVLLDKDTSASQSAVPGGFYKDILGALTVNAAIDSDAVVYDAAIRNFIAFYTTYNAGVTEYNATYKASASIGSIDYENKDSLSMVIDQANKSKYDDAANKIIAALKYLTADMTKYISIVKYVVNDIASAFGFATTTNNVYSIDNATYMADPDGVSPILAQNYPGYAVKDGKISAGYFKAFIDKLNAVQSLLARYALNDESVEIVAGYAVESNIVAAYDAMIAQLKTLTTDKGDTCIDNYLADINKAVSINFGVANENYDGIYNKLQASQTVITNYIPLGAYTARGYEYFAFTLASVALKNTESGNYYSMTRVVGAKETKFALNFFNALKKAAADIAAVNSAAYSREACNKAAVLTAVVNALISGISVPVYADETCANASEIATVAGKIDTDMPVWYAENLLKTLQSFPAEYASEKVDALAAKKTAELTPVLNEAEGMNISKFNVNGSDEYAKLWSDFQKVYEAARAIQYDKFASVAEIDAAIKALKDGIASVQNIQKATKSTDYIYAAIDEANAFIAYVNGTLDTSKLAAVIANVEKTLQYNIDVIEVTAGDALVAEIEAAVEAVNALMPVDLIGEITARYFVVFREQEDGKYTEESYNAFVAAYEAAKAVAKDEASKLADILAAQKSFNDADKALAEPAAPVEPERSFTYKSAVSNYNYAVSYLNTLKKADYTEESYNALVASIEALKAAIDNNANDLFLQNAIVDFNVALAQLAAPVAELVPEVPTLDD